MEYDRFNRRISVVNLLTMRGMNLFIAAPLCALIVALFSELPLFPQLAGEGQANFVGNYMAGFSGFVQSWYLMFYLVQFWKSDGR